MNGKHVTKSPWLLHYDGSSCNGCDIEVLACTTPVYDVERFGIINTGDPMHADIFLVTGGVNSQNAPVLKQMYDQMPEPKVVVAIGTCACTGGIFKECYGILGGTDTTIPVDIYVPGCAARPQSIIDGVVKAISLYEKKALAYENNMKDAISDKDEEEEAEEFFEEAVEDGEDPEAVETEAALTEEIVADAETAAAEETAAADEIAVDTETVTDAETATTEETAVAAETVTTEETAADEKTVKGGE